LVWLGFRRDYPISEAMTSFFFTFFKVFLNGSSGLFVTTPPRLLKIQGADKFFFHFFSLFFDPPSGTNSQKAKGYFTREPRISRMARIGPDPSDQ
jgi:hypothetical protein